MHTKRKNFSKILIVVQVITGFIFYLFANTSSIPVSTFFAFLAIFNLVLLISSTLLLLISSMVLVMHKHTSAGIKILIWLLLFIGAMLFFTLR